MSEIVIPRNHPSFPSLLARLTASEVRRLYGLLGWKAKRARRTARASRFS